MRLGGVVCLCCICDATCHHDTQLVFLYPLYVYRASFQALFFCGYISAIFYQNQSNGNYCFMLWNDFDCCVARC